MAAVKKKAKKASKVVNIKGKKKPVTMKKSSKKASPKASKSLGSQPVKRTPITVKEVFNKTLLLNTLSEQSGVPKKQVASLLDVLREVIVAHLSKKGPGKFKLPGVLLMKLKNKPATKARTGINPFNGEMMTFAAKPARKVIKITPLKNLKEEV
jgi:nucleoid DNA-binding protein